MSTKVTYQPDESPCIQYLWKRSGLERTTPMPWENKSGSGVTAGSAAPSQSMCVVIVADGNMHGFGDFTNA